MIRPLPETSLVYKSPKQLASFQNMSLEEAGKLIASRWQNSSCYQSEWQAIIKTIRNGHYSPLISRGISYGSPLEANSSSQVSIKHWPILLRDNQDNSLSWGLLVETTPLSSEESLMWSMRDVLTIRQSSAYISVVSETGGKLLWQNANSMELYGCHGLYNIEIKPQHAVGGGRDFNLM